MTVEMRYLEISSPYGFPDESPRLQFRVDNGLWQTIKKVSIPAQSFISGEYDVDGNKQERVKI